ncbi:MAG TPA: hypothetical protein VF331_22120 [Polyangiales bacterium]
MAELSIADATRLVGVPMPVWDVKVLEPAGRELAAGERVDAVVQLTPGSRTTSEALQAHARERLASFNVPVRIALHAQPLPRNENGKIQKRQLKQELGWL